jgi:hypothetical protein
MRQKELDEEVRNIFELQKVYKLSTKFIFCRQRVLENLSLKVHLIFRFKYCGMGEI